MAIEEWAPEDSETQSFHNPDILVEGFEEDMSELAKDCENAVRKLVEKGRMLRFYRYAAGADKGGKKTAIVVALVVTATEEEDVTEEEAARQLTHIFIDGIKGMLT